VELCINEMQTSKKLLNKKIIKNKINEKRINNEIEKNAIQNKIPLTVQIEITRECNYDCIFCYLNGSKKINSSLLITKDIIRNLFNDLDKLGTEKIIFSGGEPFIRKDFKEILLLTKKYGFEIEIYTNASLINEEYINILKDIRLSKLQISFYGSKEDYNKFSNTNNYFKKVINNLERLKRDNIQFYLTIPLTSINTSSEKYFDILSQKYIVYYNDDIKNSLTGKNKKISEKISLPYNNELIKKYIKPNIRKIKSKAYQGHCIGGITYTAIDAKGNVFPCYQYVLPSGNIHTTTFNDIWKNSPDLMNFRKINQKGNLNPKCSICKYNEFCKYCIACNLIDNGTLTEISESQCLSAKRKHDIFYLKDE